MERKAFSLNALELDIRHRHGVLYGDLVFMGFGFDPACFELSPADVGEMLDALGFEGVSDMAAAASELAATETGLCLLDEPSKAWTFPAEAVRHEVLFACRHCDLPAKIVDGQAEHICETDHDAIPELDGELVEF